MNVRETQLISRAQSGESDAFEELYHSYVGRIRAYFARCGFHPPDDPAQEVFLRAAQINGEMAWSSPIWFK